MLSSETLGLTGAHPAVLVSPAVKGRLAYAEFSGCLRDRGFDGQPRFRLAQLADDLLRGVSLGHKESSFYPIRAVGLS